MNHLDVAHGAHGADIAHVADTAGFAGARSALVEKLKDSGALRSAEIEHAFRTVPRHLFLPEAEPAEIYEDRAVVTKRAGGSILSSSSQPSIMAVMLEQLQLRPGHRVFEVGAGTGYNAALMAGIVGAGGTVVTVDIDQDVVEQARRHLELAGFARVTVGCRDGSLGYPELAPFDRVIATTGTPDLSPQWLEQLAPDGRLVVPLALTSAVQLSVAFEPWSGGLRSLSLAPCVFLPMRGALASGAADRRLQLDLAGQLWLQAHDAGSLDPARLLAALRAPARTVASGLWMRPAELHAFDFWLRFQPARWCLLVAGGEWAQPGRLPMLFGPAGQHGFASGLVGGTGLCLLARRAEAAGLQPDDPAGGPVECLVQEFGDGGELARQLPELLDAWRAAGSPDPQRLRIRMLGAEEDIAPAPGTTVFAGPFHRFVVDWP